MTKIILFLFTFFTTGICGEVSDDGSCIGWDAFPADFSHEAILKWKAHSDIVKQTRVSWQDNGYDHECVYCCLYEGDYRNVYKNARKLAVHCTSQAHEIAKKVVTSDKVAMHFYTFLAGAKSISKEERLAEIISAPRPFRGKIKQ